MKEECGMCNRVLGEQGCSPFLQEVNTRKILCDFCCLALFRNFSEAMRKEPMKEENKWIAIKAWSEWTKLLEEESNEKN